MTAIIKWDRPLLVRFQAAHKKAAEASQDPFTFEGNQYVLAYAFYLIEYLEFKLPK